MASAGGVGVDAGGMVVECCCGKGGGSSAGLVAGGL